MAQYYTDAFYSSERQLKRSQSLELAKDLALFGALALVGYQVYKQGSNITDLNYHHHESHGAPPVNSDGDYLYLSGAWF